MQADVGFIGINNSPWLATNYYSDQSSAVTYQGASVNVNPGGGWLLTGITFNGANYPVQWIYGSTLYNPGSIQGLVLESIRALMEHLLLEQAILHRIICIMHGRGRISLIIMRPWFMPITQLN